MFYVNSTATNIAKAILKNQLCWKRVNACKFFSKDYGYLLHSIMIRKAACHGLIGNATYKRMQLLLKLRSLLMNMLNPWSFFYSCFSYQMSSSIHCHVFNWNCSIELSLNDQTNLLNLLCGQEFFHFNFSELKTVTKFT